MAIVPNDTPVIIDSNFDIYGNMKGIIIGCKKYEKYAPIYSVTIKEINKTIILSSHYFCVDWDSIMGNRLKNN